MSRLSRMLFAAALLVSGMASADPVHNARERAHDRREVAEDKAKRNDDWRDATALQGLIQEFDSARARNDLPALAFVDQRVNGRLAVERAETRQELRRDEREVHRDKAEVRHERRELGQDYAEGRPVEASGERRDLREDHRDLHQDRRDEMIDRATLDRLRAISGEYFSLTGRVDGPSLDRKRALLGELMAMARQGLRQDNRELHEDHRELREDRREMREERRQGP